MEGVGRESVPSFFTASELPQELWVHANGLSLAVYLQDVLKWARVTSFYFSRSPGASVRGAAARLPRLCPGQSAEPPTLRLHA